MTLYHSAARPGGARIRRAQGATVDIRAAVRTAGDVRRELAQPPIDEPPTFREIAAKYGWNEAADRVNRWSANNYAGDWQEAIYDNPSPLNLEDDQP
jgi:hypothetical protein